MLRFSIHRFGDEILKLDKYWFIYRCLKLIKNLLAEPELSEAVNPEAAEMFKRSPKLYFQLARDAVVASRRLEKGVSNHDESLLDFAEEEEVSESNETQISTKPTPIKVLAFDDYHEAWIHTATSLQSTTTTTKPIRAKELLKFKTWNTKMNSDELKVLLAE